MHASRLRVIAASSLVVGALVVVAPAPQAKPRVDEPRVSCESCLLVDDLGRVLFARRPAATLPNASTTKMVTALVVVGALDLDAGVVVSARAARTGGGGLDLDPRDRYSVRDLLYALLLTSSNDAAVALAETTAGTEAAFVDQMNDLAGELGARGTNFVSPHGLDAPGHHSTARDLALIAAELLQHRVLARIVATPRATVRGPAGAELVENRNVLLEGYRGAIGVKTGYTTGAGNVLVAAARRRGRQLIAVAMRSEDAGLDSARLLDFGFERLARALLVRAGTPVGELVFDPSGSAPAVVARSVRGMTHPDKVRVVFEPSSGLDPPFARGDVIGIVHVRAGNRDIAAVPAVIAAPVPAPGRSWAATALARVLGALGNLVEPYLPGA